MAEQASREEHKKIFEDWLSSIKINSTVVNRSDLNNIRNYFISSRDGRLCNITSALKRRIKRNNFVIANFPSDVDCVCVLSEVQVSLAFLIYLIITILLFENPVNFGNTWFLFSYLFISTLAS